MYTAETKKNISKSEGGSNWTKFDVEKTDASFLKTLRTRTFRF